MISLEYRICTRCVMDTSDPSISFDNEGRCNNCNKYFIRHRKTDFNDGQAELKFKGIVSRLKQSQKNSEYDCVVGISGGVDSSYLIHLAKKLGMRSLAVHVDTGWNTEIAVQNIIKICKNLGVDYESYVIDWEEFKDIQLAILKSGIVEVEMPTDVAIIGALHKVASSNNIKYILSGSNFATEGILPEKWFYTPKDKTLIKHLHKKFGNKKMKVLPTFGIIDEIYYKFAKGIKIIYMLDYFHYDKEKAMQLLQDEYGWKYYGGKHHESKFTAFVQSYIQPVKFNIDYRRATFSTQICTGTMQREEAIELLKAKPYNTETLQSDKEYVTKKLGISLHEFEDIMNAPPKSYKNYPNDEKLYQVVNKIYKFFFPSGRI